MTSPRNVFLGLLVLVGLWCAGIVVAPLFPDSLVSSILYKIYSHVCHQFAARSFHIAGEPFGVCMRCTGVYGGFLITLAAYPILRRRHGFVVPSPWVLGAGLAPMALDVFLRFFGLLQGADAARFATGVLAGLILPFFLLPPLINAVRQIFSQGDLSHARETR